MDAGAAPSSASSAPAPGAALPGQSDQAARASASTASTVDAVTRLLHRGLEGHRQPQLPQHGFAHTPEWMRPWETLRDRSTMAMSFASAFVTDVFVELSGPFLQMVASGECENQATHSSEATIRLDDIYHLHKLLRKLHNGVSGMVFTLGPVNCRALEKAVAMLACSAFLLLMLVHLVFVNPATQIAAGQALSRLVHEAGSWDSSPGVAAQPPTVVHLEIEDVSWPQQWLGPMKASVQQAFLEALAPAGSQKASTGPREVAANFAADAVRQGLAGAGWAFDYVFRPPRYEIVCGDPQEAQAWLEIRSASAKATLGVKSVHVKVSAGDAHLFGPRWARELLSALRLYDMFVVHALPLQLSAGALNATCSVHVLAAGRSLSLDPTPGAWHFPAAARGCRGWAEWTLSTFVNSAVACFAAALLSALLRRAAILTAKLQIYSAATMRQMRRYAFIAESFRRINVYSSQELLELWASWAICMVVLAWLLYEAALWGPFWAGGLLCFAAAEYWGIVHVRTKQSRWIFPRAVWLIFFGSVSYARSWPLGPSWLLLWTQVFAQLWLTLVLLCRFDCYATLPEKPPHCLLFRSVLLSAQPFGRGPEARSAGADELQERVGQTLEAHCHCRYLMLESDDEQDEAIQGPQTHDQQPAPWSSSGRAAFVAPSSGGRGG